MASMDVGWSDIGSWSALLEAIGARGSGSVVQAGETVEVETEDLVVRRVDGHLGVIAPPERGSITAMHPMAVLRGTGPDRDRIEALHRALRRAGGTSVTLASDAPAPTTIVFGTDGWRARIADEFTFENVRRCADGVAR